MTSTEGERRLAAIMFTDMVGYTALGQRNESLSLALVEEQRKLIRPILLRHNGREVKTMGDAFLVVFPNSLDAVRCAYDIQRAVREFNVAIPESKRVHLRVGLHLGDIVESDGDVSGDAVNVASRIEPLAEDGGVCLTRPVYESAHNKFELPLSSTGVKSLKNVSEPIEVFKMEMPWQKERSEARPQLDSKRIAVLPFVSMSPDPSDEYFADGLTEELIAKLSLLRGLQVIARTSIMNYKKKEKNVIQIGEELKAGTLLEGSVRKAGNRIRITTQLIDSGTEGHLWTESYDRELTDVFAIQSSIAENVADALKLKLLEEDKGKLELRCPINPEAHEEYLMGGHYWRKGDEVSLRKAVLHFEKALQLEPRYAAAMAWLAACHYDLGANGYEPADQANGKARKLAFKALETDETNPEAHNLMAYLNFFLQQNLADIGPQILRALELNPNYADARTQYAAYLSGNLEGVGTIDEAISEVERALELDPLSTLTQNTAGKIYMIAGRYAEALAHFDRGQEIDPGLHGDRGMFLLVVGKTEEGLRELEKSLELRGTPLARGRLAYAYGLSGRRDESLKLVEELKSISHKVPVSYYLSMAYTGLGEKEEALTFLERAYEEHSIMDFPLLTVNPVFASLRGEPRFRELVKKLELNALRST